MEVDGIITIHGLEQVLSSAVDVKLIDDICKEEFVQTSTLVTLCGVLTLNLTLVLDCQPRVNRCVYISVLLAIGQRDIIASASAITRKMKNSSSMAVAYTCLSSPEPSVITCTALAKRRNIQVNFLNSDNINLLYRMPILS